MNDNNSLTIGKKSFFTSMLIIAALMAAAFILTRIIPSGSYQRVFENGREVLVKNSFSYVDKPVYPLWRCLTAPFEVLFSQDGAVVAVIILFLVSIGGVFAILGQSGILRRTMLSLVEKYSGKKYLLLAVLTGVFMVFGSAFGLLEEIVLLVPLLIGLSYALGWDSLVALSMSILAACFGFSATTLNPFTLVTAQRLAGLPLFSGLIFRIPVLIISYFILLTFLMKYAKKIEKDPSFSPIYKEDVHLRLLYSGKYSVRDCLATDKAMKVFYITLLIIGAAVILGTFVSFISSIMLPLITVIFLAGSILAAKFSPSVKSIGKCLAGGVLSTLPGAVLILMAMSVKLIVEKGSVMDTILHFCAEKIGGSPPFISIILICLMVLALNFFIGSGSAKAFLIIPIIAPLTELIGITRQSAVTAFCLGDGLTNALYPTNAMLMISLGLTVISYPKWFKFTIKLQLFYFLFSVAVLFCSYALGIGPF